MILLVFLQSSERRRNTGIKKKEIKRMLFGKTGTGGIFKLGNSWQAED
jgi:hypothetical protein